ncbi:hypothetical protein CR513_18777, partial [Mucuna pruriens]
MHSNVCGSIEVASMGDKKYFLSFVDEYTRKLWVITSHMPQHKGLIERRNTTCLNMARIAKQSLGRSGEHNQKCSQERNQMWLISKSLGQFVANIFLMRNEGNLTIRVKQ